MQCRPAKLSFCAPMADESGTEGEKLAPTNIKYNYSNPVIFIVIFMLAIVIAVLIDDESEPDRGEVG